jgi:hypothetical protein
MDLIHFKVYTLSEPNDIHNIRYIGITTKTLKERVRHHISETRKYIKNKKKVSHKINWINSLLNKEEKPFINSIYDGYLNIFDISKKEQFFIKKYKILGYCLTNSTNGGLLNLKMSSDAIKKMSLSKKGIKKGNMSDEHKLKISSSRKAMMDIDMRNKYRDKALNYERNKSDEEKLKDITIQKNRKEVSQFDLKGNFISKYPSIRNAAKMNDLNKSNIQKVCNGKSKSCGGYLWKFE